MQEFFSRSHQFPPQSIGTLRVTTLTGPLNGTQKPKLVTKDFPTKEVRARDRPQGGAS